MKISYALVSLLFFYSINVYALKAVYYEELRKTKSAAGMSEQMGAIMNDPKLAAKMKGMYKNMKIPDTISKHYYTKNKHLLRSQSMDTLTVADTGMVYFINHNLKTYAKLGFKDAMKNIKNKSVFGIKFPTKKGFSLTGKTKKVAGYKCEEVRFTGSGGTLGYIDTKTCYALKYPSIIKSYKAKLFKYSLKHGKEMSKDAEKAFGKAPKLDRRITKLLSKGWMLATHSKYGSSKVQNLKKVKVSSKLFSIPKGYKLEDNFFGKKGMGK